MLSDMDKLDLGDARAPYLQVADRLRTELRNEVYRRGDKLPVHQAISDQFGVSVGVVKRAYSLLQDEELIVTRQGQGTFVRASGEDVPQPVTATEGANLAILNRQLTEALRRLDVLEKHVGLRD